MAYFKEILGSLKANVKKGWDFVVFQAAFVYVWDDVLDDGLNAG